MSIRRFPSLLFASLFVAAVPAQDLTLDELLKKSEDAIGGSEALKAVQTIKITARVVIGGGQMEAPMTMIVQRPNLVRTEMTIQGKAIVSAYDGTTAWMINPLTGAGEPQKMDDKTASNLTNSDMDAVLGSLAGVRAAGHTIELLGKEDVEGSACYKLKVTRKSGMMSTHFLDAATLLPIKIIAKVSQMGQEMEVESYPGNFKKVGGIMIAHSLENKVGGRPMMQLTYEKIEINEPVDSGIFKMPAPEKPGEKK